MSALHSGYRAMTTDEVAATVDLLNRVGKGWPMVLGGLVAKPRKVNYVEQHWAIVMQNGETFKHTAATGWLYIGVVPQLAGGTPVA